jgi:hypothetical protein
MVRWGRFGFGVRGGGDENRKESGWVSTEIIVIECDVGFGISWYCKVVLRKGEMMFPGQKFGPYAGHGTWGL